MAGQLNYTMKPTIWWDPTQPHVLKVCTGDARSTDENGGKPGLWITVKRGCRAFERIARALRDSGQPHPRSTDGTAQEGPDHGAYRRPRDPAFGSPKIAP
ncbi:MAG: hypothetical protein ACRDOK_12805 [Streptosporangiaceae bacterium]